MHMSTTDTRTALLHAAIKIFAIYGYEGASTRMITNDINANISAVSYYYGGKKGLYEAVIVHLFSENRRLLGAQMLEFEKSLENVALKPNDYRHELHKLLTIFAERIIIKQSPDAITIFMREQANPSPFFAQYHLPYVFKLHRILAQLIGKITANDPNSEEIIILAHTVMGQVTIFRSHKSMLLSMLDRTDYDEALIQRIVHLILVQTDRLLITTEDIL